MISDFSLESLDNNIEKTRPWLSCLQFFGYGLLLPLSFAPFHQAVFAIIALAFFYHGLTEKSGLNPFLRGFIFGLGFFGLGISWIFVSIHDYGHLDLITAGMITLIFIAYLSLFVGFMASVFCYLKNKVPRFYQPLLFSCLWVLSEYLRANLFTGFPWLLIGIGQFDAPSHTLLPIIGVYGISLVTCFCAAILVQIILNKKYRYYYLAAFVGLLCLPPLLFKKTWAHEDPQALSVGIIQANLSMRDKWDERLFWQLLERYEKAATEILGTDLIVMPESAIPLPTLYLHDFFNDLEQKAKQSNSAILLGIPQPTSINEKNYYNALISVGNAKGNYLKQHLVPFGEYTPPFFQPVLNWLNIPEANLQSGQAGQALITVQKHPVATLICYELAYSDLLRKQLPQAQWIVSISDDGWFGHSLAMYQQLQMAQVRSLQAARYQVVSNNDGLSSVINTTGQIVALLPAFTAGTLKASIHPATGITPWVTWGDQPALLFSFLIFIMSFINFASVFSLKCKNFLIKLRLFPET